MTFLPIIPILKSGKDPRNPTNYRPIALTSCSCKTMGRMINHRLVWYIESHNLLINVHLVIFETFCRETFIHNQHLVSWVFLGFFFWFGESLWYHMKVWDIKIPLRLPIFISSFFKDRSFKVWVESTFSDATLIEIGVTQSSILSVTLFVVKINSITQCLKRDIDCSLYVDDFQICYWSSNLSIIESQLQLCLNKLQQCAADNGFRFSKTKTVPTWIHSLFWIKVQFH